LRLIVKPLCRVWPVEREECALAMSLLGIVVRE
jgi:hypothetical protein